MISAIVLSRNDESRIGKALSSLSWCDERIVIDDDSTDTTAACAKELGASVYVRSLTGDFAAQRNFGLSKAKGEWVLFLDSDEVVPPELAKQIEDVTSGTSHDGFLLRRRDFFLGKWLSHGETNKVRLLRLARRKSGKWQRPIHEIWHIKGTIGELQEPLAHYPHETIHSFVRDINRYTSLNAQYLYENRVGVNLFSIVLYPAAKLLKDYFWYAGFADGTQGAIMAIMMSMHSFLTRAKLYLLWNRHEPT